MRIRSLVRRGAAVMSVAALATAGLVLSVGASAGAGLGGTEKSFEEEGSHEWVVPEGVCWVWIEALGASGGDAITSDVGDGDGPDEVGANPGGEGGRAKARVPVTPGETLFVYVGGEGEDAVNNIPGEGGENGGGDGGQPALDDDEAGAGGGGGSDVRQGGIGLGDRIVVAGGGGGAGGGLFEPAELVAAPGQWERRRRWRRWWRGG